MSDGLAAHQPQGDEPGGCVEVAPHEDEGDDQGAETAQQGHRPQGQLARAEDLADRLHGDEEARGRALLEVERVAEPEIAPVQDVVDEGRLVPPQRPVDRGTRGARSSAPAATTSQPASTARWDQPDGGGSTAVRGSCSRRASATGRW